MASVPLVVSSTHCFFEMTDPAEVEVKVFTTNGRPIWEHHEHIEPSQASIIWAGVDRHGGAIANGTYLYRLRAKPQRPGSRPLERIGKIVVMR